MVSASLSAAAVTRRIQALRAASSRLRFRARLKGKTLKPSNQIAPFTNDRLNCPAPEVPDEGGCGAAGFTFKKNLAQQILQTQQRYKETRAERKGPAVHGDKNPILK